MSSLDKVNMICGPSEQREPGKTAAEQTSPGPRQPFLVNFIQPIRTFRRLGHPSIFLPDLTEHTVQGIVIKQAAVLVSVKEHYGRGLREPGNDGGGFHDALCSRGLEGAPSCYLASVPYFEGTRGTGGWASLEWPSREGSEEREWRGDGLDALRGRPDVGDGPPSETKDLGVKHYQKSDTRTSRQPPAPSFHAVVTTLPFHGFWLRHVVLTE